jgi:hypothetical protein
LVNPRDQLHDYKQTNLTQQKRGREKKEKSFINQFNGIVSYVNKFNGSGPELEEKKRTIISLLSDKLIEAVCKAHSNTLLNSASFSMANQRRVEEMGRKIHLSLELQIFRERRSFLRQSTELIILIRKTSFA